MAGSGHGSRSVTENIRKFCMSKIPSKDRGRVARPFGFALTDPAGGSPAPGSSAKYPASCRAWCPRVGDTRLWQRQTRDNCPQPGPGHSPSFLTPLSETVKPDAPEIFGEPVQSAPVVGHAVSPVTAAPGRWRTSGTARPFSKTPLTSMRRV